MKRSRSSAAEESACPSTPTCSHSWLARATITLREETVDGIDSLVCTVCLSRFPIQDGIPVLLRDDATPGPNGLGVPANA